MSASVTMAVVTTTAMTQMEVTLVSAIMATDLTAMDTLVKVGEKYIIDAVNFGKLQHLQYHITILHLYIMQT